MNIRRRRVAWGHMAIGANPGAEPLLRTDGLTKSFQQPRRAPESRDRGARRRDRRRDRAERLGQEHLLQRRQRLSARRQRRHPVRRQAHRAAVRLRASCRLGIARTFQGTRLFQRLSVAENLRAAAQLRHPVHHARRRARHAAAAPRGAGGRGDRRASCSSCRAGATGRRPRRRPPLWRPAAAGAGAGARHAAAPADARRAGGRHGCRRDARRCSQLIDEVRRRYRLAVIVVEHDMDLIMNLCERIQVLAHGEQDVRGHAGAKCRRIARVREVYLGQA